jgi:chemotaxis protein CheX
MMIDKKLQIFIDVIVNYFSTYSKDEGEIDVGMPYLSLIKDSTIFDYSSVIYISGRYEGYCYFSAGKPLLKRLILRNGVKNCSEVMIKDAAGEVANTLSGNSRKELGHDFEISVPKPINSLEEIKGANSKQSLYSIPIKWNSQTAILGITLSER